MKPPRYIFIVLLLFCLAAYINVLKGEFIWDDRPLIVDNPSMGRISSCGKIFVSDLYEKTRANYYRPIFELSLILNYSLSKSDTLYYHLTNIFLHYLAVLLLFLFLFNLTKNVSVSFISSLLFAIHPVNSQVVAYISGRADSICAVFILLALYLITGYPSSKKIYLISIFSFCLALMTKEIAIVLPVIVFILNRRRSLPFFVIAFFYAFARFTVLNFAAGNPFIEKKGFALIDCGLFARAWLFLKSLIIYLGTFVVPVRLHLERLLVDEPVHFYYYFGVVLVILFSWRTFFVLKGRKPIFFFFLFWFFIWLLPQSAFVFPRIMAEHFLYLPSMAVCFFAAVSIDSGKNKLFKKMILVSVSLYLLVLGWQNNKYWQTELNFFERIVDLAPHSIRARDSLASIYLNASRLDEAEFQYRKLIEYSGELPDQRQRDKAKASCFYNLGMIYEKRAVLQKARAFYELALIYDPKMKESFNNLGLLYQKAGDPVSAETCFKKAIEADPQYYQAYNNLAQLYAQKDKVWQAVSLWMQALSIKPDYETARKNLDIARKLLIFERK
ncbi:MAG TPA: tetratricopeptide repeat protein [Candidatus Omnitrophota bacterium]|nr:tetratricopeptide repeat protein [Candidatus Omnitrophota bacterium]